jgi:hypothetical protein
MEGYSYDRAVQLLTRPDVRIPVAALVSVLFIPIPDIKITVG